MQLYYEWPKPAGISSFAASMRCPHCGDPMIAPEMSEYVASGEIRHHWQCDDCGRSSSTTFRTAARNLRRRRNR
jgi:transposase-like protein